MLLLKESNFDRLMKSVSSEIPLMFARCAGISTVFFGKEDPLLL